RMATNTWSKRRIEPEQILLPPRVWATLDYNTIADPDIHGEMLWTADQGGMADGVVAWFDATLADGIGFFNAPGEPELIYGHAYFPLSEPVPLETGDNVTVTLHADLVRDDYV